jgi:hypothetical protein
MIKRISLLVMAALLVATMAMAGLAGPAFAKRTIVPDTPPPVVNPATLDDASVATGSSDVEHELNKADIRKGCTAEPPTLNAGVCNQAGF